MYFKKEKRIRERKLLGEITVLVGLSFIVYSPYLAVLSLVLFLYSFRKNVKALELKTPWTLGIFVLFFWALIVGVLNQSLHSTLAAFLLLGFALLSLYFQETMNQTTKIENWFLLLFTLSIGSALIGVLAKFNIITYDPAWWKYLLGTRSIVDIGEPHRIAGTFNNPNIAGAYYAIMVLVGVYFFKRRSGVQKGLIGLALLLFVCVLLWTESRGAMIGLFVGFIFYFYFSGHKKKMLGLMFTLLGCIALMLHQPDWFPRGDILFSSMQDRQAIWLNCFKLFMEKPHTGWGLFGIYYADTSIYNYLRVFHAHNIPLSIMTMLGVGGLAIFSWIFWNLFQDIRYLYQQNCPVIPLLSGLLGIILGQGIVDFIIMSPQIGILLVANSAFISTLAYAYRSSTLKEQKLALSPRYLASKRTSSR